MPQPLSAMLPDFKGTWEIRSSNSRFFPAGSAFVLTPNPRDPDSFDLDVIWEKHAPVKLVERNLRRLDGSTVEGTFPHPKNAQETFQLVVINCSVPGPDGKRRLCGLLTSTDDRIEGGGTGVWVAEGPPNEPI